MGEETAFTGARSEAESPRKGAGRKKKGLDQGTNGISQAELTRSLPASPDAEEGVLGSMMIAPREVIGECVEKINEDYFYIPAHRIIYALLVELWNIGTPIDLIVLTQTLKDRGLLDQVGGPAFVTHLFTVTPTAANVSYYVDIIREKFILRQIISTCTECASLSYTQSHDPETLLDEVEQKILAISQTRFKGKESDLKTQVFEAIETIERLYQNRGAITGVPTGFTDLDKMTNGLHPAEMIVIAARPSMGKTAFSMNIVEHVALVAKMPCAVFSLEMSTQQLVQRLLCSVARVSMGRIKDGFLRPTDFPTLTSAASKLAESKIYIDDTPGLSILELRAKARRLKQMHDIQLIVIDYLQLLRSTSRRAAENRQLEIAEISSGTKALAKELSIPIIVLAQVNRRPEERKGGRPMLSDLRESGSIEQDADVVAFLVRSEVYENDEEAKAEKAGEAELIIAKQRNGPVGDVKLTFLKEFTRFTDRAQTQGEPN